MGSSTPTSTSSGGMAIPKLPVDEGLVSVFDNAERRLDVDESVLVDTQSDLAQHPSQDDGQVGRAGPLDLALHERQEVREEGAGGVEVPEVGVFGHDRLGV
jgi:hypothetical protein